MLTKEQLEININLLQKEIDSLSTEICQLFPIQDYIKDVKTHVQLRTHSYFGWKRKRIFKKIQNRFGSRALVLYQKLFLTYLIQNSMEHLRSNSLPEGIIKELKSWYKRIIDDFASQPDKYYDITNIDFKYDVGVCCLKSLPVAGAWFIQIRRLGFRLFFTLNIVRLIKIICYLILKSGGVQNYCVIHTFPRYLLKFNCQQMNMAYNQIGELMKRNKKIRGIYRRSWFLDPSLSNISPNLSYLLEVPLENGATIFKTNSTKEDIKLAIQYSPYRRELYNSGKYVPAAYAYIWPREELLSFLQNQKDPVS